VGGYKICCCSFLQVVVATNTPLVEALRIDEFCHANGVAFIRANTRGLFAQVFTDFGPAFEVTDVDGEPLITGGRLLVGKLAPSAV
jgi:ubiquitin-activating enzyme E1